MAPRRNKVNTKRGNLINWSQQQPSPTIPNGGFFSQNPFITMQLDPKLLVAWIISVRIVSTLLVWSEFVPDEGWQSLEVTRWFVYGEETAHLTWEWNYGLRSFVYPLVFAPVFWLLRFLWLDSSTSLYLFPRLMQASLTAYGECCLIKYIIRKFDVESAAWATYFLTCNWFLFYCGTRTLTNNTEMALAMIGLDLLDKGKITLFTFTTAISFYLRPTSIVFWMPLVRDILQNVFRNLGTVCSVLITGLFVASLNMTIDTLFYKEFIHPWLRFFKFNLLEGRSNEFGTHPFLWYFYSALPSMLGLNIIWLVKGILEGKSNPSSQHFVALILNYTVIMSGIGHKEIRFLMPILPLCCALCGITYRRMNIDPVELRSRLYNWANSIDVSNIILHFGLALAMCGFHQVGLRQAANHVRDSSTNLGLQGPSIWIVMPCYSFPVHNYINLPNSRLEYMTCSPSGLEFDAPNIQTTDFLDLNLTSFVEEKTTILARSLPDFIIAYDYSSSELLNALGKYVKTRKYGVIKTIFHTYFPFDNVGREVHVLAPQIPTFNN